MGVKVSVDESAKLIKIELGKKLAAEYSDNEGKIVNMSPRRVFHKTLKAFARDMESAFNESPDVLDSFLQINDLIATGQFDYNTDEGKTELIDLINEHIVQSEELATFIHNSVEESYNINIELNDSEKSSDQRPNVLQFTNAYAKRIISVAKMSRIVLPLLTNFMALNNSRKDDKLFLNMIGHIFEVFNYDDDGEEINLANKIQKFVQINVDNTLYSDRVIWNYLSNISVDNCVTAMDIHRDLITNIIPKLEENKSIVSFFHVVIKHKIEYQFTSRFKVAYKPISQINTDSSEGVNPFVKIEQRLLKNNSELTHVLVHADIARFIKQNKVLSDEDEKYHLNNIVIHTAQTRILNFWLNKQIGRGIPILSLSKREYVNVLFIAKKWFEENGYRYISFILLGIPVPKHTVKRNFNRGKQLLEITESRVYQSIESSYTRVGGKVNSDTIIKFVAEIINTDFTFYQMPDGEYYSVEVATPKVVMVELLSFIDSL